MKKFLLWLLIVTIGISMIATFSLAGCKAEEAVVEEAPAAEEAVVEEAPAEEGETTEIKVNEPVTITLWCMAWDPHVNGWNNVIDAYKEINPNITVNFEPQPGQVELVTKMRSALVSGGGADIFTTPGTTILEWAIPGSIQPVSPGVFTVDWVKENLLPVNYLQCHIEDQIWAVGIPDGPGDWALIANTDHLKEAGLPIIDKFDSLDQLLDYGKKLSKYDENGKLVRAGLSYQESNDSLYFLSYIADNGGKFWDNDAQKFTINTPEAKEVLQFFYDLFYEEKVDSVEMPDTLTGLLQGLVSMGFLWSEFKPYAEAADPNLSFTTIMKPAFKETGAAHFSHTDTWNAVVPKYVTGLQKDAAFEFLRFLISEEGQMKFLEVYPSVSPLKKVTFESDFFVTGPGAYCKPMIDAMKAGDGYSNWGPYVSSDIMVYDIIWPNIDALIHNQLSIDECLIRIEEELNDQIERDKQKYPDMPKTIIEWDGLGPLE